MQSTIVSQFNHERLPLAISTSWNAIVTRPAIDANGCGAKSRNGTPTSTM